jgi:creatinine amidohydrolase/Fe(II)-dependent formamide hydrolase-like protein
VIGTPSLATPELGRRLFDAAVDRSAAILDRIVKEIA